MVDTQNTKSYTYAAFQNQLLDNLDSCIIRTPKIFFIFLFFFEFIGDLQPQLSVRRVDCRIRSKFLLDLHIIDLMVRL